MGQRRFKHNAVRDMEIEKQGQTSGLPLFDDRPIQTKSKRAAVLPAHRRAAEVLTPVQRAALQHVAAKMRGLKIVILDILAEGDSYTYHMMHDELARRGMEYPIISVQARMSQLRNDDALIEPDGPDRPGPYGQNCTYYCISANGLQRIADAHPGSV